MKKEEGKAPTQQGSRGVRAVKKTCRDFRETFTKGTNAIADAILDRTVAGKKEKVAKVGAASLEFVKELATGLKQDLGDVSLLELTSEASYQVGKGSAVVKKVGSKTWGMLMEKLDEDRS